MKIYSAEECPQGSPEWWTARRGVPTASNFGRILTAKTLKLSAQAEEYICELAADVCSLNPAFFTGQGRPPNAAMENGSMTEPEARKFYALERGVDVREVGFCLTDDGRFGCSPDGLVGEDGGLELKCPLLKTQAKYVLDGVLPSEYRAQVHGSLIVTGRKWWDFLSYAPGMPPLLLRVEPDEYTEALRQALDQFHERYQAALARLQVKHTEPSPLSTEDNAVLESWKVWLRAKPSLLAFNDGLPDLGAMRGPAKKTAWQMCLDHAATRGWTQSLNDPKRFVEV